VRSNERSHEPLVSDELFDEARTQRAAAPKRATVVRPRRKNTYVLSGLVHCGICDRRMQGAFAHGRAYYRCRYPTGYADTQNKHPRSVNVRESAILPGLDGWLAQIFDPDQLDTTCEALAAASEPDTTTDTRTRAAKDKIKDCDNRLTKYRAALEAGTDPTVVGRWIAETQAERATAQRALNAAQPGTNHLSKDEIRALVASLHNIIEVLHNADPKDKADIYQELGISLTYHADGRVLVESRPSRVLKCVSEAGHDPQVHGGGDIALRGEFLATR
jgi:site-specific DNA recombinase